MLKREQESITAAINNSWYRLQQAELAIYQAEQKKVMTSFETDPRIVAATTAVQAMGIVNAHQMVLASISGSYMMGVAPIHSKKEGVNRDYHDALRGIVAPKAQQFYTTDAYSELNIALSTSTKKWPQLQADVVLLITDTSAAKTYEEIATAVRTFTTSLAR